MRWGIERIFRGIELIFFVKSRYVIFFFPPNSMRRFKARRCYKDRVLMPTICCLRQCVNLEELYLEKADSPAITTYLLGS